MIMPQAFRYRLKPTKSQIAILNMQLDLCRWVYNQTLDLRKNAWEDEQKRIGYYESKRYITIWKQDKPELKEVHSHVLQDVSMRVDLALQAFFRRVRNGVVSLFCVVEPRNCDSHHKFLYCPYMIG